MTTHAWEFICFLIFVALVFKPIKNFLSSYISDYSLSIQRNLDDSKKIKTEALENVEYYSQKHLEFKTIVKEIQENTKYSIKKLRDNAEKEINQKINLKTQIHESNLLIQKTEHLSKLKQHISSTSLSIVKKYLKDNSQNLYSKDSLQETLESTKH
jgi:F-type H+-transporting ATPase subunit b